MTPTTKYIKPMSQIAQLCEKCGRGHHRDEHGLFVPLRVMRGQGSRRVRVCKG